MKSNSKNSSDLEKTLMRFVRACVESAVKNMPMPLTPEINLLNDFRGCFVTLKKLGNLRGCIGMLEPQMPLKKAIPEMAEAAALRDPRFPRVTPDELEELQIELSILTLPHRVNSIDEVMPGRDGIIVSYRGRRGCYLPQVAVETGWSAEKFVMNCAREKAGIDRRDVEEGNATLEIFQADIFEEKK